MNLSAAARVQRGASLVVGLIMLTLITVMVASAFMLSTTNLKSVGNMQTRDEAIAAANSAIELVLTSPFTVSPQAQSVDIDIDDDGMIDYVAQVLQPICIGDAQLPAADIPPSSLTLGESFNISIANFFQTVWELDANVTHVATGTTVRVRQGVRAVLNQAQYTLVCPQPTPPP